MKTNENKHTSGPWVPYSDGHVIDIRPGDGARESATITRLYPSTPLAERWENARLIATAPDLLEVLASFANAWDINMGHGVSVDIQRALREEARAALKKARGE